MKCMFGAWIRLKGSKGAMLAGNRIRPSGTRLLGGDLVPELDLAAELRAGEHVSVRCRQHLEHPHGVKRGQAGAAQDVTREGHAYQTAMAETCDVDGPLRKLAGQGCKSLVPRAPRNADDPALPRACGDQHVSDACGLQGAHARVEIAVERLLGGGAGHHAGKDDAPEHPGRDDVHRPEPAPCRAYAELVERPTHRPLPPGLTVKDGADPGPYRRRHRSDDGLPQSERQHARDPSGHRPPTTGTYFGYYPDLSSERVGMTVL